MTLFSISVERLIDKPIQDVFSKISDHASYSKFKGIDDSSLIKKGLDNENGLGAIREIVSAAGTLHEEIVGFEPPYFMAYKIVYSKPLPYNHEMGEIRLTEKEGKTHVHWQSKGYIKIPFLGPLFFDKKIQTQGARAFGSILKAIELA